MVHNMTSRFYNEGILLTSGSYLSLLMKDLYSHSNQDGEMFNASHKKAD